MKKIIISVVALTMGMMAMAAETAYVQIKITGENGGASNVYLTEDDAYTSAYEGGADVEKIMSQSNNKSLLLYGFVGTTPCEQVVTNNLDELALGFTTNQLDQNYTLTFIDVEGRVLKLYDLVENQEITITNNGTYLFSVTAAQVGRVAINDRFVINYVAPAPLVQGICFNYNKLQLTKYDGATVEVFADGAATATVTENVVGDATYEIDLSALASGKYKVAISGIATPEEYIIDVKPAVTVVP